MLTEQLHKKWILYLIGFVFLIIHGSIFIWALIQQKQYNIAYNTEVEKFALIKHFEHIIRYANDIILFMDDKNRILEANDRALDVYGYSREEMLLLPAELLFFTNNSNEADKWFGDLKTKGSFFGEAQHVKKDLNIFPVEISARVIFLEDREFCQAIIRDITERKESENQLKEREIKLQKQNEEYVALNSEFGAICEELSEQNEKLEVLNNELQKSSLRIQEINKELMVAKEKAVESDQLKSAFLANFSHEIRTPMNGIIGFSEMLAMDNLPTEKRKHYTEVIINSTNQLLSIVNDILDLSKIETGQITINKGQVRLNKLLIELLSFFKPKADKKSIQLNILKGLDDEKCSIFTDRLRIFQILSNLTGNAIKFTKEGSVTIGYELIDCYLQFFVQDTGIGIPQEQQHRLFGRFQQANSEISRNYGGTGLGLAISKSLIELLEGKIWFHSAPGVGTTFYFTIPYNRVETKISNQTQIQTSPNLIETPLNILLVEDEEINYIFIREVFLGQPVNLIYASNGIEAVELCKLHPEIDIILMDIKMPLLNGYEATHEIKQFRPEVPIIALTAYAMKEDKDLALSKGFSDYLAKPVRSGELINCIKRNTKSVKTNLL
jgi:PAS domain S-box-containing protein